MNASREMSLEELILALPSRHRARVEYEQLIADLSAWQAVAIESNKAVYALVRKYCPDMGQHYRMPADVVRKAMLAAEARGNDAPIRTITPEMSDGKDKEQPSTARTVSEMVIRTGDDDIAWGNKHAESTEVKDLKRQLAETRNTLLLIGDKAVTDWDDPVVGAVDAAVKKAPKSYAEWARNTRANAREAPRLREELAHLTRRLDDLDGQLTEARHANISQRRAAESYVRLLADTRARNDMLEHQRATKDVALARIVERANSHNGHNGWTLVQECRSIAEIALNNREPEQGDGCPQCDGPADNGHDREVPPNPYYCKKCQDKPEQGEDDPLAGGGSVKA